MKRLPAQHPASATASQGSWPWSGPPTLAECFLYRAWAVLSATGPYLRASILVKVNHQPESRMREIRPSGSEGGGSRIQSALPTPMILPSLTGLLPRNNGPVPVYAEPPRAITELKTTISAISPCTAHTKSPLHPRHSLSGLGDGFPVRLAPGTRKPVCSLPDGDIFV